MPRGGYRPGAGRKPDPNRVEKLPKQKAFVKIKQEVQAFTDENQKKTEDAPAGWPFGMSPEPEKVVLPPVATPPEPEAVIENKKPLEFLLSVMNDTSNPIPMRMQAATIAANYVHAKPGAGGKKEEAADKAKQVGAGKFAPSAPPQLKRVH